MKIEKIDFEANQVIFNISGITKKWNDKNAKDRMIEHIFSKFPNGIIKYSEYREDWTGFAIMNPKKFYIHDGHDYYNDNELFYYYIIGITITRGNAIEEQKMKYDETIYNIEESNIMIVYCKACKRHFNGDFGSSLFEICDNCLEKEK